MVFEASSLFERRDHPESGVASFLLRRPAGWWLQSFYFTNPSLSADGRFLWCYAMRAPGERKTLAVADLIAGEVRILDDGHFGDASPMVDPDSGACLWIGGEGRDQLMRRGPGRDDRTEILNRFPADLIAGRKVRRVATHLTYTADRRCVVVDAEIGGEDWHVGLLPLDGGPLERWHSFTRCYNHAQASPVDPGRILLAQDFWDDPRTGERRTYDQRLWILDRDREPRALYPDPTPRHGHEWWAPRGDAVWYVHYGEGVRRHDLTTDAVAKYWSGHILHAHCDAQERFLVGDTWGKQGDDSVMGVDAYDLATGAALTIAAPAPLPSRKGHLHPHPQVTACGRFVVYTAFTADGQTTVALCPVPQLRERLAERAGTRLEGISAG